MSKEYGILLISHVEGLATGVATLLNEVASEVTIKTAAVLAFYDLGSAKMNLELAIEVSDKEVTFYDTAFVEGAYTAAALVQADASIEAIEEQLMSLKIK